MIVQSLITASFFSAALFLALMLFRLAFIKRLSPALTYALWFLLLIRLVVPVTLDIGLRLFTIPAQANKTTSSVAFDAPSPLPAQAETGEPAALTDTTLPAQAETPSPAAQPSKQARFARLSAWDIAFLVWASGAAVMLCLYAALQWKLLRRIRKRAAPASPELCALYDRIRLEMGLSARVPLVVMDDVSGPALTAWVRPTLLFPRAMSLDPFGEDASNAIRHELTHFKRGDHLVCLLAMLLRTIYWFNPVVWLMARPLRADMEAACDASCVSGMNNGQKLGYANLLLELGARKEHFS